MIKRSFDVLLAIAGLPVLLLVGLPVALAIRLDSPGPALFRQRRIGQHERIFTLLKFRTMHIDVGDRATHEASVSHITRVGHWLRASKIDELPQLLNVLAGSMSLVGPRPCLPSQTALIEHRRARGAFDVRPGITGAAQVAGVDMSDPERLSRIDGDYCRNRSLDGDLALLWQTVMGKGAGDRVRRPSQDH
jgi:O-antigen biosynthesis protein WbqP